MRATHYRGSIDGDIKQYLIESHSNGMVSPTFKGYESFEQLWDLGVVTPKITSIRLMFNIGRGDENYIVADKEHLEGIVVNAHPGQEGLHNTEEILTKTKADYWEVSMLHPKAYR